MKRGPQFPQAPLAGSHREHGLAPRLSPLSRTWALLHSRSAFKRLFLHKSKDKKYSLEGAEEAEATGLQLGPLEAATKKHLEGAS